MCTDLIGRLTNQNTESQRTGCKKCGYSKFEINYNLICPCAKGGERVKINRLLSIPISLDELLNTFTPFLA